MRGVLNTKLIEQQNLTSQEVAIITELHELMDKIFAEMEATEDPTRLQECVQTVEDIEFLLQEAWRFPKNRDYHCWWYQVPKCQCPWMDNQERWGTNSRIISGACPLHGTIISEVDDV